MKRVIFPGVIAIILLSACAGIIPDTEASAEMRQEVVNIIVDGGPFVPEGRSEPGIFISYILDYHVDGLELLFTLDGESGKLLVDKETPLAGLVEVGGRGEGEVGVSVSGGSCYEKEKVTGVSPGWLEGEQQLFTCTFTRELFR